MKRLVVFLGLSTLAFSATLNAQSLYVSDQLEAAMRRGEGLQFKVMKMVRSGEELTVLSEGRSGYTKVRTSNGKVGYILSRYLMSEAAARTRVETFQNENNQLNESLLSLKAKVGEFEATVEEQSIQITHLQSGKDQLDAELEDIQAAAADVMAIKRKNTELAEEVEMLQKETDELLIENKAYRDNTQQEWFIRGAGVVLIGILIGLVLPKLRRRRRWGEL